MPYSYKEIERRLILLGFIIVRQNGSHVIFSKGRNAFPVPKHGGKDISPGVENKIIKNIGISKDEFRELKR